MFKLAVMAVADQKGGVLEKFSKCVGFIVTDSLYFFYYRSIVTIIWVTKESTLELTNIGTEIVTEWFGHQMKP